MSKVRQSRRSSFIGLSYLRYSSCHIYCMRRNFPWCRSHWSRYVSCFYSGLGARNGNLSSGKCRLRAGTSTPSNSTLWLR